PRLAGERCNDARRRVVTAALLRMPQCCNAARLATRLHFAVFRCRCPDPSVEQRSGGGAAAGEKIERTGGRGDALGAHTRGSPHARKKQKKGATKLDRDGGQVSNQTAVRGCRSLLDRETRRGRDRPAWGNS